MILAFYSEASGTGKDASADHAAAYLSDRHGRSVRRDAFAWDGKVVCADALGIEGTREEKIAAVDRIKFYGAVYHRDYPIPDNRHYIMSEERARAGRDFIIGLLGSPGRGNGIRGLDEGFWTRQVVDRARAFDGWTVVSDMRFVEEAEAVHLAGGKVVEIRRDFGNLGRFNEQRLPPELVDHTIRNDRSLDNLRLEVEWHVDCLIAAEVLRSKNC